MTITLAHMLCNTLVMHWGGFGVFGVFEQAVTRYDIYHVVLCTSHTTNN